MGEEIKIMEKVLLLGVVFAEETNPSRGQEFRDRVRSEALEKNGFEVRTLDNKHDGSRFSHKKHCSANFGDARRMTSSMEDLWGHIQFDHIILDYFFSPAGWARTRWTDNFYELTLPSLAKSGFINENGKIWLPHLKCVEDSVISFYDILDKFFDIDLVGDPLLNPLFLATEKAEEELMKCPDILTNSNQLQPLLDHSPFPFYCLTLKKEFLSDNKRHSIPDKISINPSAKKRSKKTTKSARITVSFTSPLDASVDDFTHQSSENASPS